MIRTEELTKRFNQHTAVDGINLNIHAGEIYGFLGPNGAGKTSTIMMLLGILPPTCGEIFLFGEPYSPKNINIRKRIGVVPEKHPNGMWPWMTAFEYLSLFADIFRVNNPTERINHLLQQVQLTEVKHKRFSEFSRGMIQKISIVRSILHDPDILFLDEPISGLDPIGIKQIRDLIISENRDGRTIFISSHLLSEMEKLCDRVGIILGGQLVAEDQIDSLLASFSQERKILIEVENYPNNLLDLITQLPFINTVSIGQDGLLVKVKDKNDHRKELVEFLIQQNIIPLSIKEIEMSLEEAFVTITKASINTFMETQKAK